MERVRRWPEERQDEAAHVLLELEAQRTSRLRLSPDQVGEVARIRRKVEDGSAEFASDGQMTAFWKSNLRENRCDCRPLKNENGKRKAVVIVRARRQLGPGRVPVRSRRSVSTALRARGDVARRQPARG
jgi:hypothetical protein